MRTITRVAVATAVGLAGGLLTWCGLAVAAAALRTLPTLLAQSATASVITGSIFGLVTGSIEGVLEGAPRASWSGATSSLSAGAIAGVAAGLVDGEAMALALRWTPGGPVSGSWFNLPVFAGAVASLGMIGIALGAVEAARRRSIRQVGAGAAGGLVAAIVAAAVAALVGDPLTRSLYSLASFGAVFGAAVTLFEWHSVSSRLRPTAGRGEEILLCARQTHIRVDGDRGVRVARALRLGSYFVVESSQMELNSKVSAAAVLRDGDLLTLAGREYRFEAR